MKLSRLFIILLSIPMILLILWLTYHNSKYRALGYAFEEKDILKKQELWWDWNNYHVFKIIWIRFKLPQSELGQFITKYHYHEIRYKKGGLKHHFNDMRGMVIEYRPSLGSKDSFSYGHEQSFTINHDCWHPELIKDPQIYVSDRTDDGSEIYNERIYYDTKNEYLYYYGVLQV